MIDSDASTLDLPGIGELPAICITVDSSDYTFDVGLEPKPDVALSMVIDPNQDLSDLKFGDLVKFKITLYNQSLIDIDSLSIVDYLPAGYSFDEASLGNEGWALNGDGNPTRIWPSLLSAMSNDSTCIYLSILAVDDPIEWVNVAEISAAYIADEAIVDCDSPLNGDPDDNGGSEINTPADDYVDGDGSASGADGEASTDQDNVDPAAVPICDLALTNQILDLPTNIAIGDTIKYSVIVENQGTIPATSIDIAYTIPNGLDYLPINDSNNPAWSQDANGAVARIDQVLGIGEVDTICIYLAVDNLSIDEVSEDSWTTFAEISRFEDPDVPGTAKSDIDSTPDNDPTNDSGGNPDDDTDNETGGNGEGDPEDPNEDSDPELDEDAHDPAIIEVCDAAVKIYTEETGPFQYQDTVKFNICLLYTSPSPRDKRQSRMPSSA